MALTAAQRHFLKKHGISEKLLFDASGMARREYRPIMKKRGKLFAYGVTPCASAGHTLKSRVGRCIQCHPANISFMMRQVQPGWVYLAYSPSSKFVKVGSTKELSERFRNLVSQGYGASSDWVPLAKARVREMGRFETAALKVIPGDRVSVPYLHRLTGEVSREVIDCCPLVALLYFEEALEEYGATRIWKETRVYDYALAH